MSDRYYARNASNHTEDWPFWLVADRKLGGLNVTAELVRAHIDPELPIGGTLCTCEEAKYIADLANKIEAGGGRG